MEYVLVSACLFGQSACRWHGRKIPMSPYVRRFMEDHPDVQLIPVCPEQLGGLPTPRPPVKVRKGRVYQTAIERENRNEVTGPDVTEYFVAGAQATLAIAKKYCCKRAILLKISPSCARTGITGKLLLENGIEVISTL